MKKESLFLLIFIVITFSGCVYKFGGAEVYNATAETIEGKDAISTNRIKYVSPSTYSLFFTTIFRKKGVFAVDIDEKDGKISYKSINKDFAEKFKLKPDFSFWEKYGFLSLLSVIALIFISSYLKEYFQRQKK